jgi:hypothetical protein
LSVDKIDSDAYINIMNYAPLVLDGLSLISTGYQYVAKFNYTGNIQWFKSLDGSPGFGNGGISFRNDTLFFAGMLSNSFDVIDHYEYPEGSINAHFGGFNTDGELIMYKRSHSTSSTIHYASSILSVGENIYVSLVNENSYPATDSARFDDIGFSESGNYLAKFRYDPFSDIPMLVGLNDLIILPNPATDYIEIVLPDASLLDLEVTIYNQFGSVLKKFMFPTNFKGSVRLNIESFQAGLYYVVVNNGSQIFSKKFVKL